MPIYKKNGKKDGKQKYVVRVFYDDQFGNKKSKDKIVYGKTEAQLIEIQLKKDISKQKDKKNILTINKLCEEYCNSHQYEIRESTLYNFKKYMRLYILPDLGKIHLNKLDLKILNKWKTKIDSSELAYDTKKGIYARLNSLLNYAVKLDYIEVNLLKKLGNFKQTNQIKKEMNVYTPEEFSQYIKVVKEAAEQAESKGDMRKWDFYVFFNIAFYTGMRKGEIFALKWSDLKDNVISIKRSINQKLKGEDRETAPKNASSVRKIMIPDCLVKILNDHYKRWESFKGFNKDFRICGGLKSIRETTLDKYNRQFAEAAGLKRIRIHDFRHSHATLLISNNVNVKEIARRLGHSDVEMTLNTYSHAYESDNKYAISILDGILKND